MGWNQLCSLGWLPPISTVSIDSSSLLLPDEPAPKLSGLTQLAFSISTVSSPPRVLGVDWAQLVLWLVCGSRQLALERAWRCRGLASQWRVLPGHSHMASTCAPALLRAWQLGSKLMVLRESLVWPSFGGHPTLPALSFKAMEGWNVIVTLWKRETWDHGWNMQLASHAFQVHAWVLSAFSCVRLFATPWTVACLAPLSMGFSRQEYWSGLLGPPPGDLPDLGIEPMSLISPAVSLPLVPPRKPTFWYKQ